MGTKLSVKIAKVLTVILAILLLVPSIGKTVEAKTFGTMAVTGTEISKTDMEELPLSTDIIDTKIPKYTGTVAALKPNDGNGIDMVLGTPYKAEYPAELNYFGTMLTVTVTVTLTSKGDMPADGFCRLFIDNQGHVKVVWKEGYNVTVDWSIQISDPNKPGEGYPVSFLVGFKDPDESNYRFPIDLNDDGKLDRALLYVNDEDKQAAKHYLVKSEGLFRLNDNGEELRPGVDTDNPSNFNEAIFFVGMNKNDNGNFNFGTTTFRDGAIEVPYFYAKYYEVTYELNDAEGPSATNPATNPTSYHTTGDAITIADPSRTGYKFLGWTEGSNEGAYDNTIEEWAEGDKKYYAHWEKINYKIEYDPNEKYAGGEGSVTGTMNDQTVTIGSNTLTENDYAATGYKWVGWNTKPDGSGSSYTDKGDYVVAAKDLEGKEDGATLATLYAQWVPIEYKVKYDPNGGEGEMDDDTGLKYDEYYNLSPNEYTREGYDWVGWDTQADGEGTDYKDKEEYKNLTTEDGGTVTMYAQWDPWKYYIDYDANGGTGDMPMQTFTYEDESMMSNKNKFTRDDYKFTGFLYTYNGNTKLITDPAEFREMLVSLGKNAKITLIAQWEKVKTQAAPIPVTGVE